MSDRMNFKTEVRIGSDGLVKVNVILGDDSYIIDADGAEDLGDGLHAAARFAREAEEAIKTRGAEAVHAHLFIGKGGDA